MPLSGQVSMATPPSSSTIDGRIVVSINTFIDCSRTPPSRMASVGIHSRLASDRHPSRSEACCMLFFPPGHGRRYRRRLVVCGGPLPDWQRRLAGVVFRNRRSSALCWQPASPASASTTLSPVPVAAFPVQRASAIRQRCAAKRALSRPRPPARGRRFPRWC